MRQGWNRRGFLQLAGAAAAAAAAGVSAGCSDPKPTTPSAPGGDGVTITHLFGQTVIKAPPKRVVSAGYTEQDDLLALGVVPIAVTNWFGDQPFAVWPWAQPKLGGAQPVVLNLDNGIPVDQISGLKPDLIVAINAGLDADTYQKLSAIAPTIAQSDGDAFFEPWKDQATAIGQAVFQADQMKTLIDGVDKQFVAVAQNHPQWKTKRALLMQGSLFRGSVVATAAGWRTDFLNQMGFVIADSIKSFVSDHRAVIPRDQIKTVLDSADVVIWTTQSPDEQKALLADPEVAGSQATAQNRHVFTTKDQAGAIAFASPLSYPMVADQLPPMIGKVLG
ncbi:ABC transporter substrate-binding protein [Mycobacterium sp. Aquia_213]|uniref:ABC transporter substrate-binding protein n=1 Tax=Mycobacterium sp. Aquia_213 TaxID=2991728 RepID=UPI0022703739|nr:ABC transporter substrate-binding protein [Mycobacterium sp. Aquia_213]WAC91225.1 ABC transporter substrate-binding protein [Mycobacterium sp. Aquia_213]